MKPVERFKAGLVLFSAFLAFLVEGTLRYRISSDATSWILQVLADYLALSALVYHCWTLSESKRFLQHQRQRQQPTIPAPSSSSPSSNSQATQINSQSPSSSTSSASAQGSKPGDQSDAHSSSSFGYTQHCLPAIPPFQPSSSSNSSSSSSSSSGSIVFSPLLYNQVPLHLKELGSVTTNLLRILLLTGFVNKRDMGMADRHILYFMLYIYSYSVMRAWGFVLIAIVWLLVQREHCYDMMMPLEDPYSFRGLLGIL
jgi:hypothetical protein